MNINSIEITNIKGIGKKKFALNLIPNKPNILVAPNGFGKSSFAIAFDSLKSNKIELDEKNYHLKDSTNRPMLSIALSNGITLIADDTQNTISDIFDIFVINNQTEPKAIIQRFAGKTFAKTTMDIITTTLIQTIPSKVVFSYSTSKIKSIFGANGNKVLNNILKPYKLKVYLFGFVWNKLFL